MPAYRYAVLSQNSTWLVTSRHVSTRRYVRRVVRVVPSCACSSMADDEKAVVLACTSLVFCALDLHQSQKQLLEMSEVDMSTSVCAPEHVSCESRLSWRAYRACLARRDEHVATRHVSSRFIFIFIHHNGSTESNNNNNDNAIHNSNSTIYNNNNPITEINCLYILAITQHTGYHHIDP